MSNARQTLHDELAALSDAIQTTGVASGQRAEFSRGEAVLRRGASITALVMLESFIRERTEEILEHLQSWPANFSDLPNKFRVRATIEALKNIEKYALMLKRQDIDYENFIFEQVSKMTRVNPPHFSFSKFTAGDYTGNISTSSVEELLKSFQIKDFWRKSRLLASDIGIGVPDVKQVLNNIISNRHKCAHVAQFNPNSSDILELVQNIRLIAICIDASLTASSKAALYDWRHWTDDGFNWIDFLELFLLTPHNNKLRLTKKDHQRAIKIVANPVDANEHIPRNNAKTTKLLVQLGKDLRPKAWSIY